MPTTFTIITIAVLFGTYDLFIKLAAGRMDPYLGAMITQIVSALTLISITIYILRTSSEPKQYTTPEGIFFVITAGILIALALVFLFFLLQNKQMIAATTLPLILVLRNISLVLLAIFVLRESLTITKILGLLLSLFGILFLSQ